MDFKRKMPYKDPEKRNKTNREFQRRKANNNPEWAESERIRKKKLMAEKRKDPKQNKIFQKRSRINKWKNSMRYWGTWEELDEIYMNTISCPICECVMGQENNAYQKSVDHDHFSLYVRDIVCKKCNNNRSKVDRNKMIVHLELYRYFNRI